MAQLAGPNAVAPLTSLSTVITAQVKGMDDTEQSVRLDLTVPLGDIPHPSLLLTREQAAKILQGLAGDPTAQAVYDDLKKRADGWLTRTPEFPARGSQWWHWYTCKDCGGRLYHQVAHRARLRRLRQGLHGLAL